MEMNCDTVEICNVLMRINIPDVVENTRLCFTHQEPTQTSSVLQSTSLVSVCMLAFEVATATFVMCHSAAGRVDAENYTARFAQDLCNKMMQNHMLHPTQRKWVWKKPGMMCVKSKDVI